MAARFDLVRLEDDGQHVIYGSEADLRDALHAYADSYGWNVQAEVPVPGWGRIDLLLEGETRWVIELKHSITKPATLRRGLTQVHGYAAALGRHVDRTILTAPSFPEWADEMAEVAYPDVELMTVSWLMGNVHYHARSDLLRERCESRLESVNHEAAVRTAALADIAAPDEDEPDAAGGVVTPEPVVLD